MRSCFTSSISLCHANLDKLYLVLFLLLLFRFLSFFFFKPISLAKVCSLKDFIKIIDNCSTKWSTSGRRKYLTSRRRTYLHNEVEMIESDKIQTIIKVLHYRQL